MVEGHRRASPEMLSREGFLGNVENLLKNGADVGVAADFDQNVSRGGPSNGLDPRDSHIDSVARQAFINMGDSGRNVIIISSRGAKDVANIVDIPGVGIVGTLGWETLDTTTGKSHIHPRFSQYKPYITGILHDVRERFFTEQLKRDIEIPDTPNIELASPDGGKIILQRKGYNDQYPEGINLTWSLNMVNEEAREGYQDALKHHYNKAFSDHTKSLPAADKEKLQTMCGLMIRGGKTIEGLSTLDVEIRPTSQGAKAKAMIQLMRESGDPKRLEHFKNMPHYKYLIYSGDHSEQDGPAMRAAHTANIHSNGKRGGLGIWSKAAHEELRSVRGVDIVVDSVPGNAALMKDVATLFTRYPRHT